MLGVRILRLLGRGRDLVGKDTDFEVWLDDGELHVERGHFIGERLRSTI